MTTQVNPTSESKEKKVDNFPYTSAGNPITPVYKRVYDDKKKRMVVKKVKEINIDEFIQSSSNSTDLALLKRRYIELGEIPAVNPGAPTYADLSTLPDNVHELYHLENLAQEKYDALPDAVKSLYNGSADWLNVVLQGNWENDAQKRFAALSKNKVKEKKEGE